MFAHQKDAARFLTRAWWGAILLLSFALPFELTNPWLRIGSAFMLTDLEFIALVTLVIWTARQILLKQLPRWTSPLTLPIGLLLTALVAASLFAPSETWPAFKVCARWSLGIALFFMTLNALDSGLSPFRLIQATVLGGIIVALVALLEVSRNENVLALLQPFRVEPVFQVGGETRIAATLGYPTIAAMYLEVILFFVAGWLALEWSTGHWARSGLLTIAVVLVGEAIILTWTRSALFAVGGAVVFILTTGWRSGWGAFTRPALGLGVVLIILLFATSIANPVAQLRLFTESDRSWYRASYQVAPMPALSASETITTAVRVENAGLRTWEADGPNAIHLAYHWLSADGEQILVFNGLRTPLPYALAPGASAELRARLRAPAQPGNYVLAWDMVREDSFWFSVWGWPMRQVSVTIVPGEDTQLAEGPVEFHDGAGRNVLSDLQVDRVTLWRGAWEMLKAHPLLGVGPGNFRLVAGDYLQRATFDRRVHANNMYVEMFADTGLLGGLAFVFLVIACLWVAWRGLSKSRSAQDSICLAAVTAAFAAFLIHGFTDYFLEFLSTGLLFWMILGILVALGWPKLRPA